MTQEILETDPNGNPILTKTLIQITNTLNNNEFVKPHIGEEAWLYQHFESLWVMTHNHKKLILLPYISEEKPGEYIIL